MEDIKHKSLMKKQGGDKTYYLSSIPEFEKKLADMFYGGMQSHDDDEVVDFQAITRSMTEVKKILDNPESSYNKILGGYVYHIHGVFSVMTGAGGAKHMYQRMLMEGLSEDEILSLIYVGMDDGNEYPLAMLKIKENEGNLRFI